MDDKCNDICGDMFNEASFEDNQDGCHVVTANAGHGIGSYESFE